MVHTVSSSETPVPHSKRRSLRRKHVPSRATVALSSSFRIIVHTKLLKHTNASSLLRSELIYTGFVPCTKLAECI